jgi:hypothetical protein
VGRAVDDAEDELGRSVADEDGLPVALEQARLATLALPRRRRHEPMLVPGLIADALGRLLVIYLIAMEVASVG